MKFRHAAVCTIAAVSLGLMAGCSGVFEFSPNQVFDGDSPEALNSKALSKLASQAPGDTVTLAVAGDTQRFYDNIEGFVDRVNALESVDLVFVNGDISDFGLLREYEWVTDELANLRPPYVAVIGNHDLVANGEQVYKRMFGPLNFTFIYGDIKFIVHNTNSREYSRGNVPDLDWLSDALADDEAEYYVTVSHVPPFDGDFNEDLEAPYASLLAERVGFVASLHGHIHRTYDGYPYNDSVRYIAPASFDSRSFMLLKIVDGQVYATTVHY